VTIAVYHVSLAESHPRLGLFQNGDLHFGHVTGGSGLRGTQPCPQRRHLSVGSAYTLIYLLSYTYAEALSSPHFD